MTAEHRDDDHRNGIHRDGIHLADAHGDDLHIDDVHLDDLHLADVHIADVMERLRQETAERIDRFGYTAMVVGTGDCTVPGCTCTPSSHPYAYSLGFVEHDHPELVAFGVPLSHVNTLMDPLYEAVRSGSPPTVGREHRHRLTDGLVVSLIPVPDRWVHRDPGRIGAWVDLYGPPLPPFVQVCWADHRGRLPWEPRCREEVVARQPILADDPIRYPRPPRNTARHRRR